MGRKKTKARGSKVHSPAKKQKTIAEQVQGHEDAKQHQEDQQQQHDDAQHDAAAKNSEAQPEEEPGAGSDAVQAAAAGGGDAEGAADSPSKRKADGAAPAAASSDDGEKPSDGLPENVVEQGQLFFLYKPKVTAAGQEPSVSNLNDVQRFYLILQPQQPAGGLARLVVVGKKRLPDAAKHERFYAFVDATAASAAELTAGMTQRQYSTATRGDRVQPAARAAGEGPYVIAEGGGRGGSHLAYKLDVPLQPGEAQAVLGIKQEGSLALSAKNPDNRGQPTGGSGGRNVPTAGGPEPQYTEEQRQRFAGQAWISITDRSLLDVAGTELLLVGARDDPIAAGELAEAGELLEQLSEEERSELGDDEGEQAQVLKQQLEPRQDDGGEEDDAAPIPVAPAVTGKLC